MKKQNSVRVKWMLAGFVAYMFVAAIAIGEDAPFVLRDPTQKFNDIVYAETGVAESKEDPRWVTAQTRIEFARESGVLSSDVNVEIKDSSGKRVFGKSIKTPWLVILSGLKPGAYMVTAINQAGVTKTGSINIPASGPRSDLTLKWQ